MLDDKIANIQDKSGPATKADKQKLGFKISDAALTILSLPEGGEGKVSGGKLKIEIPAECKIGRNLLHPPSASERVPKFKLDGKSVEIHHAGQKSEGPFQEIHPNQHTGAANDKINHPNKGKKAKLIEKNLIKPNVNTGKRSILNK